MATSGGIVSRGITIHFKGDLSQLKGVTKDMKSLFNGVSASAKESSNTISSSFRNSSSSIQEFSAKTRSAGKDVSGMGTSVRSVASDMQRMASESSRATQEVSSGFRNARVSLLDFTSKIGLAAAGLRAMADTAVGLGKVLLGPAISAEQTKVAFEGLLGSTEEATRFLKELRNFAKTTPFEFDDLVQASRRMLAFGFSTKEVIPIMTRLGDTISMMGGGKDEIDRATRAIGQMHAKTKITSEEMMQLTELGIPAWDMLAKSMGKTTAEVMEMASKGLIPANEGIEALMKGMERFSGGMEKQSRTWAGMWSNFKDSMYFALTAFGGPVLEELKTNMAGLVKLVSHPAFETFATKAGLGVASALHAINQGAIKAAGGIKELARRALTIEVKGVGFKDIIKTFDALKNRISDLSKRKFSFNDMFNADQVYYLSNSFAHLRKNASDVFALIGSMGVRAFERFTGSTRKITAFSDGLSNVHKKANLLDQVKDKFGQFGKKIELLGGPLGLLNLATIKAGEGIFKLGVFLRGIDVEGLVDNIKNLWKVLEENLGPTVTKSVDIVKNQLSRAFNLAKDAGKGMMDWYSNDFAPKLQEYSPDIKEFGKNILDLVPAFLKLKDPILDIAEHGLKKFSDGIKEHTPTIVDFGGMVTRTLNEPFGSLDDNINAAGESISQFGIKLIDHVAPYIDRFGDVIKELTAGWKFNFENNMAFLGGWWLWVKGLFEVAWAFLEGIFFTSLAIMSGDWERAFKDMNEAGDKMLKGIGDMISGHLDMMKGFIKTTAKVLAYWLGKPFEDAWIVIDGILGQIERAIRRIFSLGPSTSEGVKQKDFGGGSVGAFAGGVENFKGGLAVVGERGPELVRLPKGSDVFTNAETKSMLKGFNSSTFRGNAKYPSMPSVPMQGGAGQPIIINVYVQAPPVYLDTDQITEATAPKLAKQYRVGGGRK